jgi:hypothetical protein
MLRPESDYPADGSAEPYADGYSYAGDPVPENPWVPLPDGVRLACTAAVALYRGVCTYFTLANPEANSATPLLALSTAVYLALLVAPVTLANRRDHGWFHPLVFVSLKVLVLNIPRRTPLFIHGLSEHAVLQLGEDELTRLVAYENLLLALALAATYAGYAAMGRVPLPRLAVREPTRLPLTVLAAFAAAGASLLGIIALSGSFTQHFLNLSLNVTAKVFEGDASAYTLLSVFVALPATALTLVLACRPEQLQRPWFWAALTAALGAIFLATGKRSHAFNPLLIGGSVWMLTVGRVPIRRLLVAGAAMFVAFSMLSIVRSASTNAVSLEDVWARADFSLFEAAAAQGEEFNVRAGSYNSLYPILHYVPDQSPLLWGETYLTILLRPIPRAVMPNKPRGTDFRAGVEFFGASWGIPPGPIGEAFWNFHVPGVVLVFFLTGIFYRWLADFYLAYRGVGIVTLLYITLVNGFSPTENVITLLMHAVLIWLILAFASGALRLRSEPEEDADAE